MSTPMVWYVAYGSNVSEPRLQRYLDRCDDVTSPRDRRATTLPHRLFFAHHSSAWGGGSAFVDPVVADAGTRAMAWLVGADQFLEILAMENAGATVPVGIDDLPAEPGTSMVAVDGRYGLVLATASPDQRAAFTFTTGAMPLPAATLPSASYVDTIVAGLVDGHGLSDPAAREYLVERGAGA